MSDNLRDKEKYQSGFFSKQITMGTVVLTFFVVSVLATLLFYNFRQTIYSYSLTIPDPGFHKQITFQYGPRSTLSNQDYFQTVKKQFAENSVNFIEADLSAMRLVLYKNGKPAVSVPILTKGREGSWWETPAGIYKIETKEENHFSSFGSVNQPWSLAFQGNFFIHGWPTYPDGTPVASTYSGGCIRLSDEDAKSVYDNAEVGMPVLVYEKDFGSDSFNYSLKIPPITATQYLAVDLKNNYVFLEKDSTSQVPIASITKLLSALISAEYFNLDKKIEITKDMIATTSKSRLVPGEKVIAFHLLYPLLLESSNEAAEALAKSLGRTRFISLMNQKLEAIGMKNTVLVDPSGVSAGNLSTAEDLYILSRYLYNNRSFILRLASGNLKGSAYGTPPFKDLANFNQFAGDPEFVGGKIGKSSSAQETMLTVFEIPIKGEIRPVAIIVLGSSNVKTDISEIRNFIVSNYQ